MSDFLPDVPTVDVHLSSRVGEGPWHSIQAGSFPAPVPRPVPDSSPAVYVSDVKRMLAAWLRECADWMDRDAEHDDTYGPQGAPDEEQLP